MTEPAHCRARRLDSSSHEVFCLITPSASRVRWPQRVPSRWRLPSSGFRNLSTVYTPRRLAGLFHPAGVSRLPPSGPSLPKEPCHLPATVAFLPLPSVLLLGEETKNRRLGSKALLPLGVRCHSSQRLNRPDARCPLGVFPLQGIPSFGRGPHFGGPPLMSFSEVRA